MQTDLRTRHCLLLIIFLLMQGSAGMILRAQQTTPQDKPPDKAQVLQEIVGDYDFDVQEQTMTIRFFAKDGMLYGGMIDQAPEVAVPVAGSPLKFTITTASSGRLYELEFMRNDKKAIDRCIVNVGGQVLTGLKKAK
jgi:hypothetical protein